MLCANAAIYRIGGTEVSDEEPVTRREVDQRLAAAREYVDGRFATIIAQRDADARALILQAERDTLHFESLNNEAARIKEVLDKSVPREVYEQYRADQQSRWENLATQIQLAREGMADQVRIARESLEKDINLIKGDSRFDAGRNLGYMGAAFTLGAALVGVVFKVTGI